MVRDPSYEWGEGGTAHLIIPSIITEKTPIWCDPHFLCGVISYSLNKCPFHLQQNERGGGEAGDDDDPEQASSQSFVPYDSQVVIVVLTCPISIAGLIDLPQS